MIDPVGVLADMYGEASTLPWHITVHFQAFPAADILRCPDQHTIQAHYTNVLKEANYLKHGDGNRVNSLSLEDSNNLCAFYCRCC
jgi:autophagy-related protein 5